MYCLHKIINNWLINRDSIFKYFSNLIVRFVNSLWPPSILPSPTRNRNYHTHSVPLKSTTQSVSHKSTGYYGQTVFHIRTQLLWRNSYASHSYVFASWVWNQSSSRSPKEQFIRLSSWRKEMTFTPFSTRIQVGMKTTQVSFSDFPWFASWVDFLF